MQSGYVQVQAACHFSATIADGFSGLCRIARPFDGHTKHPHAEVVLPGAIKTGLRKTHRGAQWLCPGLLPSTGNLQNPATAVSQCSGFVLQRPGDTQGPRHSMSMTPCTCLTQAHVLVVRQGNSDTAGQWVFLPNTSTESTRTNPDLFETAGPAARPGLQAQLSLQDSSLPPGQVGFPCHKQTLQHSNPRC